MFSQSNIAKESSSLQNHIVQSCSIFVTQECSHHAQPRLQAKQLFFYFSNLKLFSTFMQYMSVSHGYSTMGGIEYDDGGYVEKTKKREGPKKMTKKTSIDGHLHSSLISLVDVRLSPFLSSPHNPHLYILFHPQCYVHGSRSYIA